MVWANSGKIGCGVHVCPGGTFVVCNYSPAGNYRGQSRYTKGPWCSKCANAAGWCKNKLCNSNCTSAGVNCKCAAICYNCAKLDLETCQCKSAVRDGVAWTARCGVRIHTNGATSFLSACVVLADMEYCFNVVLLCAVCAKQTQTQ